MPMPDGLDDELREQFGTESEEHLDTVERLLATPPDGPGVASVFRAFHSLKGMSSALGVVGMAQVSHRCEDLLGLARQGRLAMSRPVLDGLLAAVDVMRGQRSALLEGRADPPPPAALLRRLEALEGGEASPAPAADVPPPAEQTVRAPVERPALVPLARGLRDAMPRLVAARLTGQAATGAAASLARVASGLGQFRLAGTLGRIGQEAPLPLLGLLRRQLAALEGLTGTEAGAAAIVDAASEDAAAPAVLRSGLATLAALLRDDPPDRAALVAAARAAGSMAAALGHDPLEQWMLLLEDLADRAAADADAAVRLDEARPLLRAHLDRCAREGAGALERGPAEPSRAGSADLPVPEELGRLLGEEARARVARGLAAGRTLFRARLGIPASAAEEAAVQGWLDEQGAETLTSRTLLDTTPPTLDMLFLAPAEPEALEAARIAFDPAGRLLLAMSPLRTARPGDRSEAPSAVASLRVRQDTVDTIIALEAELHAAALTLDGLLKAEDDENLPAALSALGRRAAGPLERELGALSARIGESRLSLSRARSQLSAAMRRLDEAVLELRVVPVGTLFNRLPRIVRSVAQANAKDVALEMEGQEIRIDRALVELLADPLLHLVRNAVDHGVEAPEARAAAGKPPRATVRVRAERRTGTVRVEIADDGRGIDRAVVLRVAVSRGIVAPEEARAMDDAAVHRLLFRPGFSTQERVSETSGRGVGLDVVQEAMRRAGGTLDVSSTPGRGSRFVLTLPLSAAMASVLLVRVSGHVYALPAARVEAVTERTAGAVPLAGLLGLPSADPAQAVAMRQTAGGRIVLAVDAVLARTELLLRPLSPVLAAMPAVGGVGILPGGEAVVILEPDGIDAARGGGQA